MVVSFLTFLSQHVREVVCQTGDCGVTRLGLTGLGTGFELPDIFGMLMVYGLGLILVATILNRRRHTELAVVAANAGPEPGSPEAKRAQRDASEKYIYPFPTAEKAAVLRCLSEVAEEAGGGYRVTNRADMARLARPEGVSNSDWYRAMAAYHMTKTDFSVVNAASKIVAAVEYLEPGVKAEKDALDDMRHRALEAAGLAIIVVGPDTPQDDIAAWLRKALDRHMAGVGYR